MYRYLADNELKFEISLNKQNPELISDFENGDNEFRSWLIKSVTRRGFKRDRPFGLSLELMELHNVKTPSDITIALNNYDHQNRDNRNIALYEWRREFVFQNGVFFMSIADKKEFQWDVSVNEIKMTVASSSETDWVLKLYGRIISK